MMVRDRSRGQHQHWILVATLPLRSRRILCTRCTPFYALAPAAGVLPSRYTHAHCTKNERGSIVEEGEAYSCIEHSRHVGSQ